MWQLQEGGPSCADARGKLAGVWDADRRAALAAAFAATGRPHAASSVERTAAVLDDYATQWAAMRDDACEATHLRGEQSGALLDLRMRCLDRRRAELGALVQLFTDGADGEVVDGAIGAALKLAPLDGCADIAALTAAIPLPADPAVRGRVDELRAEIDRAEANKRAGKYRDGLAIAAPIAEAAREVAHEPLLTQALYQLAELQMLVGDDRKAEETFHAAALSAARSGDDTIAAQSWCTLVALVGYRLSRLDDGRVLARVARAAVARAGDPPRLRALLARHEGAMLHTARKYDEAAARYRDAIAILEAAPGVDDLGIAATYNNLGLTLESQYRLAEAREALGRALELFERIHGPDHPVVGAVHNHIGGVLLTEERPAEGRAEIERALAIAERALGAHSQTVSALNTLGNSYFDQENYEEAARAYGRGVEMAEQLGEAGRLHAASVLGSLANAMAKLKRHDDAIRHHRRSAELLERALGPDHPNVAIARFNLGQSMSAANRPRDAVEPLESALALFEKSLGPNDPVTVGGVIALGSIRSTLGDHEAARRLLDRALARAAEAPEPRASLLARASLAAADVRRRALGWKRALPDYERALRVAEAGGVASRSDLPAALGALGEAHLETGRPARAIPLLERAIEVRTAADASPALIALSRFALARALRAVPASRRRALAVARQALAEAKTGGDAELADEIDAWLAAQRR
jgi:tetratricopeptide (TPR) repeat protein